MRLIPAFAIASTLVALPVQADETAQKVASSKAVVKEFMGQLKGELQTAIKAGGPLNAISVCNQKAPDIAHELSEKYGWDIGRTSLKTRNPANKPDSWETRVLNAFEQRKAKGEAVEPMAYYETIEMDGKKQFRFMKAIPTGEVCLKCHGRSVAADVKAKIDKLYPEDQATGFDKGDIRGAFTITRPW